MPCTRAITAPCLHRQARRAPAPSTPRRRSHRHLSPPSSPMCPPPPVPSLNLRQGRTVVAAPWTRTRMIPSRLYAASATAVLLADSHYRSGLLLLMKVSFMQLSSTYIVICELPSTAEEIESDIISLAQSEESNVYDICIVKEVYDTNMGEAAAPYIHYRSTMAMRGQQGDAK